MALTITTDNKWRHLTYRSDVPASVLADQFDYQNPEDTSDGFFKYRGYWYHIDGFMRAADPSNPLTAWDGYAADSYFSGVVIKLSRDGESIMVGRYMS